MADAKGSPIMPDGPLPSPARPTGPAPERCLGCGRAPHVGTRCPDRDTARLLDRIAALEAEIARMRPDYERGKAALERRPRRSRGTADEHLRARD